jgi:hypothetical protein
MRRRTKVVIGALVAPIVVGSALLGISFANADIETSAHGVHTRLMLPIAPGSAIGIHMYGGTADRPHIPGYLDGPVVRRDGAGWKATWYCENMVSGRTVAGNVLSVDCGGKTHQFALEAPAAPAAVAPMPAKVAVLSDIEGNKVFLDAALAKLGVTGPDGRWAYGANHLVVVGDAVDRGRDVFAVLWQLHQLALQAQAAGGNVTLVLGNHEQYVMRGNLSRAHPEHIHSAGQMGGFAQSYAAGTVIGDWLRSQPVVLQLGDVLFAHGGISPAVAAAGLDIVRLNDGMHKYWDGQREPAVLDAVIGEGGVTQYRGYVGVEKAGIPTASAAEVDAVLARFNVKHIVVGHTIVDRVKPLYGGKVYAVDVNDNAAAPEALVFENGQPKVVNLGIGRQLPEKTGTKLRPLVMADFDALSQTVRQLRTLSTIPKPY